jgi:hypothetical protein
MASGLLKVTLSPLAVRIVGCVCPIETGVREG